MFYWSSPNPLTFTPLHFSVLFILHFFFNGIKFIQKWKSFITESKHRQRVRKHKSFKYHQGILAENCMNGQSGRKSNTSMQFSPHLRHKQIKGFYLFLTSLGRIGLSTLKADFMELTEVLSDTMVSQSWLLLRFFCSFSCRLPFL